MSAAQMQLLTAKLAPKDLNALKKLMLRPGFVAEWNSLDSIATAFAKVLSAKDSRTPSVSYRHFTTHDPEAVLWLGFTTRDAAIKERYEQFLKVWPEARQRIPHALMQEMRITPELPAYPALVQQIFLELIDGRLTTPEETRAFLEPHSPPAPPPQVTIKRSRAKRGAEPKAKERSYEDEDEAGDELDDEDLDDIGGDDEEIDLGLTKGEVEPDLLADEEGEEIEEAEEEPAPSARKGSKEKVSSKPAKTTPARVAPVKPAPPAPKPVEKKTASKPTPAVKMPAPAKAAAPRPTPGKAPVKPAPKVAAKTPKTAAKLPKGTARSKPVAKVAARPVPAKKKAAHQPVKHAKPAKPAARKPVPKPVKKRR